MPNECMNTLGIMGKKEDVEEFAKFVFPSGEDEVTLFNSCVFARASSFIKPSINTLPVISS